MYSVTYLEALNNYITTPISALSHLEREMGTTKEGAREKRREGTVTTRMDEGRIYEE
jgi:hypothetical protein